MSKRGATEAGSADREAVGWVIPAAEMGALFGVLGDRGYGVLGPTIRDGAIVIGDVSGVEDLPVGWRDEQDGGRYRLSRRRDEAWFGYTVGPDSWKKVFFPKRQRLWQADRDSKGGVAVVEESAQGRKVALLGVRACDLRAIGIQDRVFMGGGYRDPHYAAAREDVFVIAVQCGVAGGTCFCASMGTGPEVNEGADLILTELIDKDRHEFWVLAGSEAGEGVLEALPVRRALPRDEETAKQVMRQTRSMMGRTMDSGGLRELLRANLEHPRWHEVAERCLACANCTMVCPTCFCSTVEEVTDLTGEHAERWRLWDSCFSLEYSYIHGGSVRTSMPARYRQWMTHKLGTWFDQFGVSGCVGCGRCITWCPVGIDITEEVDAIRSNPIRSKGRGGK